MQSTISDEWAKTLAAAELRSFADRLYVPEGLEDRETVPIVVVVDEIRRWALLSREDAWRSAKNRASLRLELTHAMNGCGERLSAHMSSKLHNIEVALCSVAKVRTESSTASDPISDRPDRSAVIAACEAAKEALQSDANVELALLDLIDAAMSETEAVVISRLRAVIVALLEERGIDGQRQLSTAIGVLNSSALETEIVLSDIGELGPGALRRNVDRILSDEKRVQIVRKFLLAPASIHRCVAWLQFQLALVREREIDAGDIVIFRAADIIHSALEPNALSVSAFADEIREIFRHTAEPVNYTRLYEQSVALVRVDLGSRPLHGALRTARRAVNTLIELSVAQNHGVEWASYGRQTLLVDGRAMQFGSSGISRVRQHNQDYKNVHGMNQTASGLAEWGNKISRQLISGKTSEYLSEAISLQAQAVTLRNSDERFGGSKTSVERSIITLDDRVIELVGSFGHILPSSLVDYAFNGWAMATWHSEVTFSIRRALDHPSRGDLRADQDIYSSILRWEGERQIVSYVNASKNEAYLLSIDESKLLTEFMASRLASLRDPDTFLALYASYIQQGDLVKSRLRRVRNAVVHGNPASDAAIALACDASRYASESAVSRALEQLTSGESMATSYEDQADHRESQLMRLKSGDSWIDIWSATA